METLRTDFTFEKLRKLTLAELISTTGATIPFAGRELISIIVLLPTGKSKVELGKEMPSIKDMGFYGMWAGRPEMKDSITWTRNLRKTRSQRLYEN